MKWELFISWRYFTARRKERFISLVSLISILGIALGVMALMVVIAVMNGFDRELREKIVGVNPHIYIERPEGIDNFAQLLPYLESKEHVLAASGFINGEALFKARERYTGVLLRGIDPSREGRVSKLKEYLVCGSFHLTDADIIIGEELAKRFYLSLGDKVSIISPDKGKSFDFRVGGIFNSGMYEYDLKLVVTNINAARKIFPLKGAIGGIGVRLDNLYRSRQVRDLLQKELGGGFWVRDWTSMNRSLFSALQLEKTTMFVIVALIVVVACFNIAAHLIMMVMEKTKDIGILKAIGATNQAIKRIFTLEGLIIALSGTSLGTLSGLILCYLLKTYEFIRLPPDIYYLEKLPVEMRWIDSLIIIVAAVLISLVAALYPAEQAARLSPADTLRYE